MESNSTSPMDEDEIPTSLTRLSDRIYYGSLEEQERKRLEAIVTPTSSIPPTDKPGLTFVQTDKTNADAPSSENPTTDKTGNPPRTAGNIQKVGSRAETYELPDGSQKQREIQEEKYAELVRRRRARAMAVPTAVSAVKQRLRELGHPITLFAESDMDRRERLREVLAKLDADGKLPLGGDSGDIMVADDPGLKAQVFYTEGTVHLAKARLFIAQYSLARARDRIVHAKRKRESADEDEDEEAESAIREVAMATMQCSEIGDDRPLSACAFSSDGSQLATSAWSGVAKIWSVPAVAHTETLRGHTERVTGVAFHPHSSSNRDETAVSLATASADKTAMLWSSKGRQLGVLTGHIDRLARLAFHPSGRFVGTASFDKTWRLWDVNTGSELLLQEGHSRSVYTVAFHGDGSLAASAGLDALARLWDLRTGRSIMTLVGHVKAILSADFSPNGYHLATASEDHSCRVWDLRRKGCLYVIPAHSSLVSQVRYEPRDGNFLVTSSYDNTARVWSGVNFKAIKTLAGHEGKLMGMDVAPDGQYIGTVSYDRTLKLWAPDSDSRMDTTF